MSSLIPFILGSLGMTIMAAGVVIFIIKYQNRVSIHAKEKENILAQHEIEILKASISGEEVERNRIAAELHDDIAASLAILSSIVAFQPTLRASYSLFCPIIICSNKIFCLKLEHT